ncbi:MAG: DMT family transporter, partial [Kiloniellales bacterium]|nr:DMT family transporter [Kiloniellales bacterium]
IFAVILAGGPSGAFLLLKVDQKWLQVLRGVLLLLEIGVFVLSFRYLALADAHVLMATAPLMVTGLSVVFLSEVVGLRRWGAIAAGLLGVAIVLQPEGDLFRPAALIALSAAFLFALYQVVTRRVSRKDSAVSSLLYLALVGLLILTFLVPFFWVNPTLVDFLLMVGLGFLGALGHFTLIKALEAAPASTLQPFFYAVLVWAVPLGYLLFGQVPSLPTFIGAAVIVACGLYTFHRESLRKPLN